MADFFEKILAAGVVGNSLDADATRRQVEELNKKWDKDQYEKEQQNKRNEREARDRQEREDWERGKEEEQRQWEAQNLEGKIDELHTLFSTIQETIQEFIKNTEENLESIKIDISSIQEELLGKIDENNNSLSKKNQSLSEKIDVVMLAVKKNMPELMVEHYSTLFQLAKKMGMYDKNYIKNLMELEETKDVIDAKEDKINEMISISIKAKKQRDEKQGVK